MEADGAAAGDGAGGGGCVAGQLETLASAALVLPLHRAAFTRTAAEAAELPDALSPPRASFSLPGSPPPAPHFHDLLAQLGPAMPLSELLWVSYVGSLVGIFIGAFMGMSTESGMLRGAGVGAVSGAVFSIEAVESCIEIWRFSHSGKYNILFVMSLLSTPFMDNNDLFETGSTGGMSRDLIYRIPKLRFSVASNCDKKTDSSCCLVCLQDFGAQQFVRALSQCQHVFHVRCIDNWLLRQASCPLCQAGVHIDHIHM
ncbi:unnamed protein product [Urochloa humidicola]